MIDHRAARPTHAVDAIGGEREETRMRWQCTADEHREMCRPTSPTGFCSRHAQTGLRGTNDDRATRKPLRERDVFTRELVDIRRRRRKNARINRSGEVPRELFG